MDALPILPVKANQQFAAPTGASGLTAVFQALLLESELRLEARSDLPTRGPSTEQPASAEPVTRHAPTLDGDDTREGPAPDAGANRDDAEPRRAETPDRYEAEPATDSPEHADAAPAPEHAEPRAARETTTTTAPDTATEPVADEAVAGLAAPSVAGPAAPRPTVAADPTARSAATPAPAATHTPVQTPTATTAPADAAAPSVPTHGAVRAEVTPAPVIAPPNAKLGGGAAHAALSQASEPTTVTLPNVAKAPDQPATAKPAAVQIAASDVPAATAQRSSTPIDHLTTPHRVVPITVAPSQTLQGAQPTTTATAPAATPQVAAVAVPTSAKAPASTPAEAAIPEAATAAAKPAPVGPRVAPAAATATPDHGVPTPQSSKPRVSATGSTNTAVSGEPQAALPRLAPPAQAEGAPVRPEADAATSQPRTAPAHAATPAQDGQIPAAQARIAAPEATATVAQAATPEVLTSAARTYAKAGAAAAPLQRIDPVIQPGGNGFGSLLSGLGQPVARSVETLPAQPRLATTRPVPIDQVAVHIRKAAVAGQDHIRIRLHPAELGQIDVRLQLNSDGAVKAAIAVDRAETLDLLQRDARGLERSLQDAGLKTDSGSLSFHLRGEGQGGTKGGQGGAADAGAAGRDGGEAETSPDEPLPAPPSGAERALDITV